MCTEKNEKDTRATEFFIRTLCVELSSKAIYVTKKWGYNAQTKVRSHSLYLIVTYLLKVYNLVKLLNTLDDPNQHITPSNLLIVVHNHPEVLQKEGLQAWIKVDK